MTEAVGTWTFTALWRGVWTIYYSIYNKRIKSLNSKRRRTLGFVSSHCSFINVSGPGYGHNKARSRLGWKKRKLSKVQITPKKLRLFSIQIDTHIQFQS
jgi:hypothetical protein